MEKVIVEQAAVPAAGAPTTTAPPADHGLVARIRARARQPRPPSYRTRQYRTLLVFVVVIFFVGPWVGGSSRAYQFMVNTWLMYSIVAVGFYWVFSLAGRFAFTQTFMMSVGAYTSAWWTLRGGGHSVLSGMLLATAVGAVLALGIFILLRRAQAIYFGIGTLAVASIGLYAFSRWPAFTGPGGTTIGVPPLEFFGKEFVQDSSVFWLFFGILIAVLILGIWIERSPLRREAIAGREKPGVASLAGVSVNGHQMALFMLGSAVGAMVGALGAHWVGVVATDTYGIDLGIGLFLMLILGGRQSMWGPVLGAAFYVALPELIKSISTYQRIVYGVVLLVVIMALPFGIVGLFKQLGTMLESSWGIVRSKRGGKPPVAAVSAGSGATADARQEPGDAHS
jgi:branched-chain amino acid transport system permease protein